MSNNIGAKKLSYNLLSKITSKKYPEKSVLIIGSGFMTQQYCHALKKLGVRDMIIFARNKNKAKTLAKEFDCKYLSGSLKSELNNIDGVDLVIITTSVSSLPMITEDVIQSGQKNILIEKPGSLYYKDLKNLGKKLNVNIRIAYNRLAYPNFYKLKEILEHEEITSCKYSITEKVDSIDFTKDTNEIYTRWGISNSLHVITMAHELIGMPKEIHAKQFGNLKWHPSGSIFVGHGITEKNIPFSYHADWESAGRWGIEIMTKEHAYRLMPLENLYVRKKGSFKWNEISVNISHPEIKQGISEEIALMFNMNKENEFPTPEKGAEFIKLAEIIFGYK